MAIPMHRKAERLVVKCIVAVIAFTAILSLATWFFSLYVLSHSQFRFSRIAQATIRTDILVVGNSRGINLATGSSTPPTVFNLSYNGLGRPTVFDWIRVYFERGNTARVVVIEATALYNESPSCDTKPYWVLYGRAMDRQRRACASDDRSARFFPLTMFNSEQYLRALYHFFVQRHGEQSWANEYTIPPRLCAQLPVHGVESFRIRALSANQKRIKADIAELENWLKQKGVKTKLVFVMAPVIAIPRTQEAIRTINRTNAQILAGRDYLDLSTVLGGDCANFADDLHVGQKGRSKELLPLFAHIRAETH